MEKEDIKIIELYDDIELRLGIKYESFISNIQEKNFEYEKRIFQDKWSYSLDEKLDYLKEYYIKEIIDKLNLSQKAALWDTAYHEEEYDISLIGGSFPVEWTDFIFENLYYEEDLVLEYLIKYINPFKVSAHSEQDLYFALEKLSGEIKCMRV